MVVNVDDIKELSMDDLSVVRHFLCNTYNFVQIGAIFFDDVKNLLFLKQTHG